MYILIAYLQLYLYDNSFEQIITAQQYYSILLNTIYGLDKNAIKTDSCLFYVIVIDLVYVEQIQHFVVIPNQKLVHVFHTLRTMQYRFHYFR